MSPTRIRLLEALAQAPARISDSGGCVTADGQKFQRSAVHGAIRSGQARRCNRVAVGPTAARVEHLLVLQR